VQQYHKLLFPETNAIVDITAHPSCSLTQCMSVHNYPARCAPSLSLLTLLYFLIKRDMSRTNLQAARARARACERLSCPKGVAAQWLAQGGWDRWFQKGPFIYACAATHCKQTCTFTCVNMHVISIYLYIHMYICAYLCAHICKPVCTYVCMCVYSKDIHIDTCIYIYIYILISLYIYIYIYMYLYVFKVVADSTQGSV